MRPGRCQKAFPGKFKGKGRASEDSTLYDAQEDTVYVYNQVAAAGHRCEGGCGATEQVLSKDMMASEFGKGGYIRMNGSVSDAMKKQDATYSAAHTMSFD